MNKNKSEAGRYKGKTEGRERDRNTNKQTNRIIQRKQRTDK